MLKGINPVLSPELLKALCEMGHGDELVIADGNFPCESVGKNAIVVRTDGFDLEASIVRSDGVSELYVGTVTGPRIEMATSSVVRSPSAREYVKGERMYGLVGGHLLWAWDIEALGSELGSHASARLAKVD